MVNFLSISIIGSSFSLHGPYPADSSRVKRAKAMNTWLVSCGVFDLTCFQCNTGCRGVQEKTGALWVFVTVQMARRIGQ
ncbi:hypothetical protein DXA36_13175 [Eisenbergiella sp. OF01-20]|nr:hypothetical protein DXA36_13175 [Eisenbergiella sp. OF01-20]